MNIFSTLADVAKRANTSVATVSYVINGYSGRYISDELRQRVLKAANELNYVKSNEASTLKKASSRKVVAVLIPQPENQFFMDILVSCNKTLNEKGYEIFIGFTMDDPAIEKSLLIHMLEKRVDGIIISPTSEASKSLQLVNRLGIPLVVLSRPISGIECASTVRLKSYDCSYKGAEYLVQNNHTHIGFVGWSSVIADSSIRIKACLDVYDDYGISRDFFHIVKGEFSSDAGYDATRKLLTEHPDTTAIFYGYHILALGGLRYLKEQGYFVPKDISVLIYGHPEWVSAGENDYSYIEMHPKKFGTEAAELIFKIMQSDNTLPPTHITIDGTLNKRSSVRKING